MTDEVERVARGLPHAHKRALCKIGPRWVKGTGFVHSSVITDLIGMGLLDFRYALQPRPREVKINSHGLAVRAHLKDQPQ
jgi:hypothetical protein